MDVLVLSGIFLVLFVLGYLAVQALAAIASSALLQGLFVVAVVALVVRGMVRNWRREAR